MLWGVDHSGVNRTAKNSGPEKNVLADLIIDRSAPPPPPQKKKSATFGQAPLERITVKISIFTWSNESYLGVSWQISKVVQYMLRDTSEFYK